MVFNLAVNSCRRQIASVAELRQELVPFDSEQFRHICLAMDRGGPSLSALLNGNIGWLMYLRHDDGDAGVSSRNLAFDGSPPAPGSPVLLIKYRLSNGQMDEYPASWALPEQEIMRSLEYFVAHDGERPPFVDWHDNGSK